jgi:hypothetical protein
MGLGHTTGKHAGVTTWLARDKRAPNPTGCGKLILALSVATRVQANVANGLYGTVPWLLRFMRTEWALEGNAMTKKIGTVPVKSRVPRAVWAFAGLLTVLSTASSLIQLATNPDGSELSASSKEVLHANATWHIGTIW